MMNKLVNTAEKQHRALKLRIYPTEQQEILINKTFGCCRQIYNNRLFEKNQFYETVIKPEQDKKKQKELWKSAHFSTEKEMKEKFPYLKEVSSQALQAGAFDEAENLTGNGQNVFTHKYVKG
jgi:putative transposase